MKGHRVSDPPAPCRDRRGRAYVLPGWLDCGPTCQQREDAILPKFALIAVSAAVALGAGNHPHSPAVSCGHAVTAKQTGPFIEAVWSETQWRRGSPPSRVIESWHKKLRCAGPANRRAMVKQWKRARHRFYQHRRSELQRLLITPYPGPGDSWWAIPYYIVGCESGGDYNAQNPSSTAHGAYQMLSSTYASYCDACDWSPADQDLAAHRLYTQLGASPWVCG